MLLVTLLAACVATSHGGAGPAAARAAISAPRPVPGPPPRARERGRRRASIREAPVALPAAALPAAPGPRLLDAPRSTRPSAPGPPGPHAPSRSRQPACKERHRHARNPAAPQVHTHPAPNCRAPALPPTANPSPLATPRHRKMLQGPEVPQMGATHVQATQEYKR
jgi:hypothetical protein